MRLLVKSTACWVGICACVVGLAQLRSVSADEGILLNTGVSSRQVEASSQEWQPLGYRYNIGYVSTSSTTGPLGKNGVSAGVWNRDYGIDLFLGFSKSADTFQTSAVTSVADTTTTTGAQTVVTTYSGARNPLALTLAAQPKIKLFMNNWVQIYSGFLLGVTKTFDAQYPVGTETDTYANRSSTQNYSVSQSNYGTQTVQTSLELMGGPLVGSEFYLKWIPHLALGFSAGLFVTTGGSQTTLAPKGTQSFQVTNGVAQTPTSGSSTNTTSNTDIGNSASTFGSGGSLFSLLNTSFTVRYVW